jgi:hypothetical protein
MSSQFSYELDERKIRILMQGAEINYNEALWDKFDELDASQSKSNKKISNYFPKINFGISRSIIVPILFIVLIGGLSAILFSFIDFKKKESIEKEVPFISTKLEPVKKNTIIKPIIKPKVVLTAPIIKDSVLSLSIPADSLSTAVTKDIKKAEALKISETKQKKESVKSIEQKKEITLDHKKKKRKMKVEKLRTINTSNSLNENSAEHELELR